MRIPSQAQAPVPKRALKKYPLQERGPFVFIWMGDGEPDEARLPAMSNLGNPDYKLLHGHFELAGSYLFMCENLYDLTHFVYLHKKTFGFDDSFFDTPAFTIERDDGLIAYRNLELDVDQILGPLPPDAQQELAGQVCTRPDDTVAFAPGIVQSHFRVLLDGQEEATDDNIQGFVQHFMTPVTKSSCLYWWGYSINRGLDMPEEFHAGMRGFLEMGYTEDVVAVQKMQKLLENDTTPFEEMNIAGDKAGKLFRRVILKWAAEENGAEVDTSELSQPDVFIER